MTRRFLLHGIILLYLITMLSGFMFAVLRIRIPFMPETLMQWSYRSMAPWQGYATMHRELLATGETADGTRENIPLERYFPFRAGQRMVMEEFASFAYGKERNAAYTVFAKRVLSLEQQTRPYVSLKLSRISWPMSPEGRNHMKTDTYITSEVLTIVP